MKYSKSFASRVKDHLLNSNVSERGKRGDAKTAKPMRRYAKSRALRFAECAARKDRNVERSSRGMFFSVSDLLSKTRRRPIPT